MKAKIIKVLFMMNFMFMLTGCIPAYTDIEVETNDTMTKEVSEEPEDEYLKVNREKDDIENNEINKTEDVQDVESAQIQQKDSQDQSTKNKQNTDTTKEDKDVIEKDLVVENTNNEAQETGPVTKECEHKYELRKTIESTCTKSGSKEYQCTICDEKKKETLSKLGHSYESKYTIDKKATCQSAGSKSQHCTRCDAKTNITAIAKDYCSYVYSHQESEPICTTPGKMVYKCEICGGKMYADYINKDAHNYKETDRVQPTTSAAGKIIYTCSYCKKTKEEKIDKLLGEYVGKLSINSVGINVSVYNGPSSNYQAITDKKDSACLIPNYLNYGIEVIGDHVHQDFNKLSKVSIGDTVKFNGKTYTCFDVCYNGYNKGSYLTNNEGTCISQSGCSLALYTCNSGMNTITIIYCK